MSGRERIRMDAIRRLLGRAGSALALAVLLGSGVMLAACEHEGPAERAGEEIDEAVDAVEDAAE